MAGARMRLLAIRRRAPSLLLVVLFLLLFEFGTGLYIWWGGAADRLFLAVVNLHLYWGLGLLGAFLLKLTAYLRRKPLGRQEALSLVAAACFSTSVGTGLLLILQGPARALVWTHLFSSVGLVILVPLHLLKTWRYLEPLRGRSERPDLGRRSASGEAARIFAFVAFVLAGRTAFVYGLRALRGVVLDGPQGVPVTTWTETPAPLAVENWRLSVHGAVQTPRSYTLTELRQLGARTDREEIICVTGWRANPLWEGVALSSVLAEAGPSAKAESVTFVSATGYRWDLSWEVAQQATLAWALNGEPLVHAHGAPLRLVAPGRRGLEWVKWLVAIEVNERPVQTLYP